MIKNFSCLSRCRTSFYSEESLVKILYKPNNILSNFSFLFYGIFIIHIVTLTVFSIARHIQKHMRLFNVVESLDNGKTIRETRDADIPTVVRHFYHHAGWAQLMETEMRGWKSVGKKSDKY